ncbi:MAG: lysophospholipid acyltransferase family protein [Alphaproteobacteria bacterium]|nr:lysophospholipid acyltransferase family protein [Alphaproteobacteria bacterium SS10]
MDGMSAREISYAFAARSKAGRAMIRSIENLTGRPRLIKMADGYDVEVEQGRDFWEVMQERYSIHLDIPPEELSRIPSEGPVVVVANHPFGILDGLVLGRLLSMARPDFKIVANKVFHKAKDLEEIILPISFDEDREALQTNIQARRSAISFLGAGGCIGIFPGGTVSTSSKLFNRPMDPAWKTFTARMIQKSDAAIVPVYFEGHNSRLFQIASHLNENLRVALLIKEFDKWVGEDVRVRIGNPLPQEEIQSKKGDPKILMDYLRTETYKLSPTPIHDFSYGHNFD